MHALRRFDLSADQRAQANLLIFWAGEAPKAVTASDDGLSDYNVVDVIREAKASRLRSRGRTRPQCSN